MIGCKFLLLYVLNLGILFSIEVQELNYFYLKIEIVWIMVILLIINRCVFWCYVIGEGNYNVRKL